MNFEGEIVEDESLVFGYPVEHEILHPENIFVFDEAGDDMGQFLG